MQRRKTEKNESKSISLLITIPLSYIKMRARLNVGDVDLKREMQDTFKFINYLRAFISNCS